MEAAGLEISCRTMGPWTCWCRRMRCRQPVQEKDDTAEQLSSRGDQGREEPRRDWDVESSGGVGVDGDGAVATASEAMQPSGHGRSEEP